jgi:ELWxxDGT repeat protein
MRSPAYSLLSLALSAALPAQGLVRDVFAGTGGQPSSGTQPFVVLGNRAVFVATGPFGDELYTTDGTPAGTRLLRDLRPHGSSAPEHLTAFGNVALFTAFVPGLGRELWRTDGTTAGTQLVIDLVPGANEAFLDHLVVFGGHVYFAASTPATGSEIWRTDGTAAGTTLVADLVPGPGSSFPQRLAVIGGQLWFTAIVGADGREIHRLDANHTVSQVADLNPGPGGTTVLAFRAFGNGALLAADAGTGYEPYVSDGTAAGTRLLGDLFPGPGHSNPEEFTVLGGLAVFSALDPNLGRELYVTDGTPNGTSLLRDLWPGVGGSSPQWFAEYNGRAVFAATDDVVGREVWVTDGTSAGTALLADLYVGLPSSNPAWCVRFGNEIWFSASTGLLGLGDELWRTDGTSAGTFPVGDLVPGTDGTNGTGLTPFGTQLLLRGSIGGAGLWEPCVTDGTPAGTQLLLDVAPANPGSAPTQFTPFGDRVLFGAEADLLGRELLVSNGTTAGTSVFADVRPGVFGSNPGDLWERGDDVFFAADTGTSGRQLFVADRATLSVVQLTSQTNPAAEPRAMTRNGGLVVFSASSGSGREPWVSDGTVAGTLALGDLAPGAANSLQLLQERFVTAGNLTYFAANDGVHGDELWATDGTPAGTRLVLDIHAGGFGSFPTQLVAVGDRVYFAADDGIHGSELWVSDGTAAGTHLAVEILAGPAGSVPADLVAAGGTLYFTAFAPVREIHRFDGTTVTQLTFTGAGVNPPYQDLTPANGGLFFLHDDQSGHGIELWHSGGTAATTQRLLDIAPGFADGPIAGTLTAVLGGTQVQFAAHDLDAGLQLWTSDGTVANTRRISDFGDDGHGAATLGQLRSIEHATWFAADDGLRGSEPWRYDPTTDTLAFVYPYGRGCSSQAVPTIGANGLPQLGNASFAVTLADALPQSFAILVAGRDRGRNAIGGDCTIVVASTLVTLPLVFTDAGGRASNTVALPNAPAFTGLSLYFQWAVYDPIGPAFGSYDLTGGLQTSLGN